MHENRDTRSEGDRSAETPEQAPEQRTGWSRPGSGFRLVFLGLLVAYLLSAGLFRPAAPERVAYSEFREMLTAGQIDEVTVVGSEVRARLTEEAESKKEITTTLVSPELADELSQAGVKYSARIPSTWLPTLLSWIVPVALLVGLWFFLARRMAKTVGGGGGGLMSIGKSRAKVFVETNVPVRFSDVAGVDEAREELKEVVAFLRNPDSHGRLGARMPKGVLLVGPPGTGKTLFARAVAGEAEVPFFSINGSEFVEMFVGVGAARVRDLFEQARKKAPCIIFIDELDALGRARTSSAGLSGGHDEKEQTLNQLLVELDGFDPSSGIVLLGATNRPEVLDPALLRAGRFDRQVLVDRPDVKGRTAILGVHAAKVKLDDEVELEQVAGLTPGFTGADLANLINEAALTATRRGADSIAMADFTVALERIVAGLERKNRLINPKEREIVAHHEMGHALVAGALPGADAVHKVSIIPRGVGALGYTLQRPTDDRFLMTREELETKIAVLLGGRAAEHVIYGHLSTGASDDLGRATDIARSMVTRFAMVPELGHATFDREPQSFLGPTQMDLGSRSYSEATAERIDRAVTQLVGDGFDRARAILSANENVLRESAATLLERETLDAPDLETYFARLGNLPTGRNGRAAESGRRNGSASHAPS